MFLYLINNDVTIIKFFLFFVIYSFLGWCFEVAYAFTEKGHFINRGFLYGPFCPIYGLGITIIVVCLAPFKNNLLLLFLMSTILTSALEYITGYMLERFFNAKWWDYTNNRFNIKGRICLSFSIVWGIASVLVLLLIHPIIEFLVYAFSNKAIFYLYLITIFYFMFDFTFTIISLIKLTVILSRIQNLFDEIITKSKETIQITRTKAADKFSILYNKYGDEFNTLNTNHLRFFSAFPNLRSYKFEDAIKLIKNKIKELK